MKKLIEQIKIEKSQIYPQNKYIKKGLPIKVAL